MDPISDFLIRIKNAQRVGRDTISVPHSNFKYAIAELLCNEGWLGGLRKKGKRVQKFIEVDLIYNNGKPRISDVQRVSKLSRRTYMKARDIRKVRNGHGLLVLSTPKGILTGDMARKENLGGEALFMIW